MPRSLDPNVRMYFVLDCDKDKVPTPRCYGRHLSQGKKRALLSMSDSIRKMKDPDQLQDAVLDAALSVISGWENMIDPDTQSPIEFSRKSFEDVYSTDDMLEIVKIALISGGVDADDRKKSELQPTSDVESYAQVV